MVLNGSYVIARTGTGRPTVQHKVNPEDRVKTACGYDMSQWSRHFMRDRIDVMLCRQPGCRHGG